MLRSNLSRYICVVLTMQRCSRWLKLAHPVLLELFMQPSLEEQLSC